MANETKHTPGPWIYDGETMTVRVREWSRNKFMGDYRGCIIAGFEESYGDAGRLKCSGLKGLREEVEANARLIAAAPELLTALKKLFNEEWRDDDDGILIAARMTARHAIAKAEGR